MSTETRAAVPHVLRTSPKVALLSAATVAVALGSAILVLPLRARGAGGDSDKFAQVRGFKVEIAGSSGKAMDGAWDSVSATEIAIDELGRPKVVRIVLRGCADSQNCSLTRLVQATLDHQDIGLGLLVTPVGNSDTHTFFALPRLTFSTCVLVSETMHNPLLSPIRAEIDPRGKGAIGTGEDFMVQLQCDLRKDGRLGHEAAHTIQQIAKSRHDATMSAINNTR